MLATRTKTIIHFFFFGLWMAMNLPCVENSDRLIASTCTQISSLVSNLSVFFIYFKCVPLFICLFLVEVALGIIRKKKKKKKTITSLFQWEKCHLLGIFLLFNWLNFYILFLHLMINLASTTLSNRDPKFKLF